MSIKDPIKDPTKDKEMTTLMYAIVDYFTEHPNAADSVEGIHQWWLAQNGVACSVQQVQVALEQLCGKKIIIKTTNQSGGVIYSSTGTKKMH